MNTNLILFGLLNFMIFSIFLTFYYLLMMFHPESWEGLPEQDVYTIFDAFYFTTAIHTHTGYSQIQPKTRFIRFLSSIHMIIIFCLIVISIDLK